jgi:hypothetical protein
VAGVVVGDSNLFLVATPVVADAEEVTFEAMMAPRHEVPEYAAELASGTLASAGVGGQRRLAWLPLTSATSRRARGRAGCRGTAATRSAAVGRMNRGVDNYWSSTSRLDALLSVHEAGVKVTRRHGVVAVVHRLNEVVVVAVEADQNILRELRITERLSDGRQRVRERLDLVVVVVHRGVELLALAELATQSRRARHRLLREAMLQMSWALLAKRMSPATPSVSKDCSADTIA